MSTVDVRPHCFVAALFAISAGVACGSRGTSDAAADVRADAAWPCPAEWVRYDRGGCGPAILLCTPGGGAALHACDDVDISRPHDIALPDGGATTSFYRLPDGGIGGPWPSDDWVPDAGIPSCAAGWRRMADGTCDPALRLDCAAGSDPLPAGECTPTSERDCPTSEYADVSAETIGATVVRVRAGADPSGADGSEARPLTTIAQGVAAAGPDGWVLIAPGSFAETLVFVRGVHLVGQCAAHVTLLGEPMGGGIGLPTVAARGGAARLDLRGMTLRGGGRGIDASGGARVTMRAVTIDGATEHAVLVSGAGTQLTGEGIRITSTRVVDSEGGMALRSAGGGIIEINRSSLVRNAIAAVYARDPGSAITIRATVVRDTQPASDGTFGIGVTSQFAGRVSAFGVVLANNRDSAVLALGRGSRIEISDGAVTGTLRISRGSRGHGLHAATGATLIATRVLLAGNHSAGAIALGEAARLEISDSVVRGTRSQTDGTRGFGLHADDGGAVVATRVQLVGNRGAGAFSSYPAARLELTDSIVRGTVATPDPASGQGLDCERGAALIGTRVLVERNERSAVSSWDVGSRLQLTDSIVRGTLLATNGASGFGLLCHQGATLIAERVLITQNRAAGVLGSGDGTQLVVTDSAVSGTLERRDGFGGYGMTTQFGATLSAARVLVANNRDTGIWGVDGSSAMLADVVVDVVGRTIHDAFGAGVLATNGAHIRSSRLAIHDVHGFSLAAVPRLQTADTSSASASDLFVAGVGPSGVSFTRLTSAPVSYGLYAGAGCTLDASRAVIDTGDWGFFRSLGTLALRDAVITRQDHAAGATNDTSATAPLTLDNVVRTGNANDEILRDVDLVEIDLPPPPEACLRPPCM